MAQDRIDISHLTFTSRVFPTPEDMALWNSLSVAEQQAVILRDVETGLNSPAVTVSASDLMQSALARHKRNAG
jgi:hypothetical protein